MPSSLVTQAFLLASEIHASQTRKASLVVGVPYLSHLMEVAGMVMASGAPDVAVAAALLHDAIEDQGKQTRIPIQQLGSDVLALVEECTEPGTGEGPKAPWIERKQAALRRIRTISMYALMIAIADKLHNARELGRNASISGDQAFQGFRVDKASILWFHSEVVREMQQRLSTLRSEHPQERTLLIANCWLQELHTILTSLQAQ